MNGVRAQVVTVSKGMRLSTTYFFPAQTALPFLLLLQTLGPFFSSSDLLNEVKGVEIRVVSSWEYVGRELFFWDSDASYSSEDEDADESDLEPSAGGS